MNGEQALIEIHDHLRGLRSDVTKVMVDGCAKREGDLTRIKHVETGLNEMKDLLKWILRTSIVTAFGIIAFLLKAFLPYVLK